MYSFQDFTSVILTMQQCDKHIASLTTKSLLHDMFRALAP